MEVFSPSVPFTQVPHNTTVSSSIPSLYYRIRFITNVWRACLAVMGVQGPHMLNSSS
jgi:hypothetical protein